MVVVALVALIVAVVSSMLGRLAYPVFMRVHRVLSVVYVIGALHEVVIPELPLRTSIATTGDRA